MAQRPKSEVVRQPEGPYERQPGSGPISSSPFGDLGYSLGFLISGLRLFKLGEVGVVIA